MTNFRQAYTMELVSQSKITERTIKIPYMRVPHAGRTLIRFMDIPLDDNGTRRLTDDRKNHVGDFHRTTGTNTAHCDDGYRVPLVLESAPLTRNDTPCLTYNFRARWDGNRGRDHIGSRIEKYDFAVCVLRILSISYYTAACTARTNLFKYGFDRFSVVSGAITCCPFISDTDELANGISLILRMGSSENLSCTV
jgi:hypothetical protein